MRAGLGGKRDGKQLENGVDGFDLFEFGGDHPDQTFKRGIDQDDGENRREGKLESDIKQLRGTPEKDDQRCCRNGVVDIRPSLKKPTGEHDDCHDCRAHN